MSKDNRLMRVFITIYLVFQFLYSNAQQGNCHLRLGKLIETLKSLEAKNEPAFHFKDFQSFDFKTFTPMHGEKIDKSNYFEIGYDNDGVINEIIHHESKKGPGNYKFWVYNFEKYRILLLQQLIGENYDFTPTALVLSDSSERYMINVAPQFGVDYRYHEALYYESFPVKTLKEISVIMELDENLYPTRILKIANGRVVIESEIHYRKDNSYFIEEESTFFFLTPEYYPKLKVNSETCPLDLFFNTEKPDLIISLHPRMHGYDFAPLWIFNGAHDYIR